MPRERPYDSEAFIRSFEEGLDENMATFAKATENFPFPPGEEHREAARLYREEQASILKDVMNKVAERKSNKKKKLD